MFQITNQISVDEYNFEATNSDNSLMSPSVFVAPASTS